MAVVMGKVVSVSAVAPAAPGNEGVRSLGHPVRDKGSVDGWTNFSVVMPSLSFEAEGEVVRWRWWAHNAAGVKFVVYRPTADARTFTVVGVNEVTTTHGEGEHDVTAGCRIHVQAGDCIGLRLKSPAAIPFCRDSGAQVMWGPNPGHAEPAVGAVLQFPGGGDSGNGRRDYAVAADWAPRRPAAPIAPVVAQKLLGADVEMATLTPGQYPPLMEMGRKFETEFGLSGSLPQVIDAAAALVGVDVAGKALVQKAEATWDAAFGKPSDGGAPAFAPGGGDFVQASVVSTQPGADHANLPGAVDGAPRLTLVPAVAGLRFDHAATLRAGGAAPLTARGAHVGPYWHATRDAWGHWSYIDLGVSGAVQPLTVKLEGPYIVWYGPHGEMVFDISMWQLVAGRHLVVVKATPGNPGGPTRMSKGAAGRDFVLYDDGTIGPRTAPHLRLGDMSAPSPDFPGKISALDMNGCWCCICFPMGPGCFSSAALGPDRKTDTVFWPCLPIPLPEDRVRIPGTNTFMKSDDHNTVDFYSSANCLSGGQPCLACGFKFC